MAQVKREKGEGSWGTVNKKGTIYIRFRKSYDGVRKEFTGLTKQDVIKKVKQFENELLLPKTNKEIAKMYLEDYLLNYMNTVLIKDVRETTFQRKQDCYKHIQGTKLGHCQMSALDKIDFERFLKDMTKKDLSKASIDKCYFLLNQCMKYAVDNNDIRDNPMKAVSKVKEKDVKNPKRKIAYLEEDDIKLLYQEAERLNTKAHIINGKAGSRVYGSNAYAILFLLFTGLRVGEALALKWNKVDFETNTAFIDKSIKWVRKDNGTARAKWKQTEGEVKTLSSHRNISLCEEAVKILRKMNKLNPNHKADDYIFTSSSGKIISDKNLRRTLLCMLERAECKVQNLNIHGLRHTYASYLYSQDKNNLLVISKQLGHKNTRITEEIYIDVFKSTAHNVVVAFDNLIS